MPPFSASIVLNSHSARFVLNSGPPVRLEVSCTKIWGCVENKLSLEDSLVMDRTSKLKKNFSYIQFSQHVIIPECLLVSHNSVL